uniref:Uncharacterized protein n=1 Tax=Trypanosoma congolense (strain IL3000) TaxID=1068625 RepID=G0UYU0_TRYCI|nr:conserved hypothetical protein [Trypanosoma congolense IL3000]
MCSAYLISASYDKEIRFWDGSTGRMVRNFSFQGSQVNAMLVIPDTTHLAVAGFAALRIYDMGAEIGPAGGSSGACAPPLFSIYENQYAMNLTSLGTFPVYPLRDGVSGVDAAENSISSLFCTGTELGTTSVLELTSTGSTELLTVLFATSEDGHIRFFNANSPTALNLLLDINAGAAVTCSAVSPDRHTLITGSQIGRVSVWHLPSIAAAAAQQTDGGNKGAPLASKPLQEITFDGDYTAIRSIAVDPLARWAVAATNAGKLHFMRFGNAQLLGPSQVSSEPSVKRVAEDDGSTEEEEVEQVGKEQSNQQVQQSVPASGSAESVTATVGSNGPSTRLAPSANTVRPSYSPTSCLHSEGNREGSSEVDDGALVQPSAGNSEASPSVANELLETGTSTLNMDINKKPSTQALQSSSPGNIFSIQQQFSMKVFYTFQAHHKYILKVAISPNMDLLVTCSADYTVGRFILPSILQCHDHTKQVDASDHPAAGLGELAAPDAARPVAASAEGNRTDIPRSVSLLQPKTGESEPPCANAFMRTKEQDIPPRNVEENTKPIEASTNDLVIADAQPTASTLGNSAEAVKKTGCSTDTAAENHDATPSTMANFPPLGCDGDAGDVLELRELKPLTGHTRWVWDCVFSDCGRFLFTASSDQTLRMWASLLSDRPQSTSFIGHMKPVVCCILYIERRKKAVNSSE